MRYCTIGKTDIEASVIGLGTWVTGGWLWGGADETESIDAIRAGLDLGITLIDTAPVYGFGRSEEIVGKALAGQRNRAVLVTKCGQIWHTAKGTHAFDSEGKSVYHYLGPESIRYELEQSLRRLQTDYIDLYLVHFPDKTTPVSDTMGALTALKDEGKIRAIGVSNVTLAQLQEYGKEGPIAADQEKYSLLDRDVERDLLPYCYIRHISMIVYSPLVQGLLTGKIRPDRVFQGDDMRKKNPRFRPDYLKRVADFLEDLKPVADRHHITFGQLAIAWTLLEPGATHALVGARNPDQVRENAPAGDVVLDADDRAVISEALRRHWPENAPVLVP
jgi:methylglyoxal reductase